MNGKIRKRLTMIARSLPIVEWEIEQRTRMTGAELIKKAGIIATDSEGKPYIRSQIYEYVEKVKEPINHLAQLKKYYTKEGTVGIQMYFDWLREHMEKLAKEDPRYDALLKQIDQFNDQVPSQH